MKLRFAPWKKPGASRAYGAWALALWATAAAVAAADPPAAEPSMAEGGGRVVGGEPAAPGSAPWQAELYSTYVYLQAEIDADAALPDKDPNKRFLKNKSPSERVHRCGGVYIGQMWVLTAAHCVWDAVAPGEDLLTARRVRLGTQNLSAASSGVNYRIERVVVHKDYNADTHQYDIALLHIQKDAQTRPLPAGRVKPARIIGTDPADRPLAEHDTVFVTGWGLTGSRDIDSRSFASDGTLDKGSSVLMEVKLTNLSPAACAAVPDYRDYVNERVVCAGSASGGHDSCNGDSGGPLTRIQGGGRVLVGLVSWGKGCGLPGIPGIYTKVSAYRDWIMVARQAPSGKLSRR